MSVFPSPPDTSRLSDRLRGSPVATAALFREIIGTVCRRYPSLTPSTRTTRIENLIKVGAWAEAALALIELELPLWQVRRIAYDGGEWHCALSRERELPDWLDQSMESRHSDLALAILTTFVEASGATASSSRPSVPAVACKVDAGCIPLCCENFG
jgi:hypothetical protein